MVLKWVTALLFFFFINAVVSISGEFRQKWYQVIIDFGKCNTILTTSNIAYMIIFDKFNVWITFLPEIVSSWAVFSLFLALMRYSIYSCLIRKEPVTLKLYLYEIAFLITFIFTAIPRIETYLSQ